jgi:hypothetical protein
LEKRTPKKRLLRPVFTHTTLAQSNTIELESPTTNTRWGLSAIVVVVVVVVGLTTIFETGFVGDDDGCVSIGSGCVSSGSGGGCNGNGSRVVEDGGDEDDGITEVDNSEASTMMGTKAIL